MICEGWDVTGTPRAVEFGKTITGVEGRESAPDIRIAPAWVDIQVNGYAGVDYNDPKAPHEEIARSIRVLHSTGVARFLPTIITGSPENMTGALANIAAARESVPEGVSIEGFHVEGPHISPDDGPRGAHPRRWVRPPDVDEFQRWQEAARGLIRLVTLSPEWPQATRYIEALVDRGVVASIGHTKAEAAQIADAVRAGATFSTHLGNGAHAVLRRHPNYIWEQLAEDRLMAGFIVDGIHLPQSFLRVALRAKGVERSVLVTDAAGPAGCKPGRYRLGEQEVDLTEDERVVLAGQERLAGSALRMDRGIENLVKLGGLSLADAVRMATVNPARAVGVAGRQAGLEPGERADLVLFRWDPERRAAEVAATYVDGEQVYSAASSSVVV
ncbi:MAG: N-acetylglucosamine-6-phosphate deacetylase [Bryobacterales bacterium]|nr:N-acetylglucosamine-6-phosphate deacetylase [Bryobacterales bacterium]